MNDLRLINQFILKMNKNAPLNNGFKYPYKPILIIAIFEGINLDLLFNKKIDLTNEAILRNYYNLISNNYELVSILSKQKSKDNWFALTGFNEELKQMILANIKDNPANKLFDHDNQFYEFNKKENWIRFNITHLDKKEEYKQLILKNAFSCLKKCVPNYDGLNETHILNYEQYLLLKSTYEDDNSLSKVRKYQWLFAKVIKDRDKKCLICCETNPCILQACHIKPYVACKSNEHYDENNGITLCANHHKMFDNGLFTFNDDWTVLISKNYQKNFLDSYLIFKQFEPCYNQIMKNKTTNNLAIKKYLAYRYSHIFKN